MYLAQFGGIASNYFFVTSLSLIGTLYLNFIGGRLTEVNPVIQQYSSYRYDQYDPAGDGTGRCMLCHMPWLELADDYIVVDGPQVLMQEVSIPACKAHRLVDQQLPLGHSLQ